jgi:transcriptional regulator with XRE-family HTH domain
VTLLYALLGRQIAHYRKQARLTQEALAEATNYSVDFISLVERGVNAPTLARLKNIADTIGVEVWQLFYPKIGQVPETSQRRSRIKRNSGTGSGRAAK